MGICADCPKAKACLQGVAWDLIDAENGGMQPKAPKENQRACPGCGLTPADFKEHGRLGCSKCYETFEGKLEAVINKLHRGGSHLGKVPGGKKRVVSAEELAKLKRRLEEYVSREEYEMAAEVRDQIKALGKDGF